MEKVIVTLWDDGLVHWDEQRLIRIIRVGSHLDEILGCIGIMFGTT
jgi:hypothetical protein